MSDDHLLREAMAYRSLAKTQRQIAADYRRRMIGTAFYHRGQAEVDRLDHEAHLNEQQAEMSEELFRLRHEVAE